MGQAGEYQIAEAVLSLAAAVAADDVPGEPDDGDHSDVLVARQMPKHKLSQLNRKLRFRKVLLTRWR